MDAFDFDGPADGGCWMSHEDDDIAYENICDMCHEPCVPKRMSKHTPGACRYCCPVHQREYQEELARDEADAEAGAALAAQAEQNTDAF